MNALRKSTKITTFYLVPLICFLSACGGNDGWQPLFNGQNLDGWKISENPNSFTVSDGTIVCRGKRAHAFYTGLQEPASFKNFELKVDVLSKPGTNSGIYFHTAYQEGGWPNKGYQVQINNTHKSAGSYHELKKTGSLYAVRNTYKSIVGVLPFSPRHLYDPGNGRGKDEVTIGLRKLLRANIIMGYPVLVEKDPKAMVSQHEHTLRITKTGCEVLTSEDH